MKALFWAGIIALTMLTIIRYSRLAIAVVDDEARMVNPEDPELGFLELAQEESLFMRVLLAPRVIEIKRRRGIK